MTTIQELMDSNRAEGQAQGKAEGKAEAERALVTRVLTRRFGPLSDAMITKLARADHASLARWAEEVLDVASPGDLL